MKGVFALVGCALACITAAACLGPRIERFDKIADLPTTARATAIRALTPDDRIDLYVYATISFRPSRRDLALEIVSVAPAGVAAQLPTHLRKFTNPRGRREILLMLVHDLICEVPSTARDTVFLKDLQSLSDFTNSGSLETLGVRQAREGNC